MKWAEVDIPGKMWSLPAARSKNALTHEVALTDDAIAILKSLPRIEKSPYVFTTTGKTAVSGWSKSKRLLDAAIVKTMREEAVETGADPETVEALPGWTIHDLRRTTATNLQRLGVRLEVTEAVLNHVSGSRAGIVGVYQRHDWAAEKRQALDMWARRLAEVIGQGTSTSNIVVFPTTGAA
jgi:integrase